MYLVVLSNFPELLQEENVLLVAPTSGYTVTELFIDTSLRLCSPRRVVPRSLSCPLVSDTRTGGLFGSAARCDGDKDSDIDLVVVSDAAGTSEDAAELVGSIERWIGNRTHVVTVASRDLRRMRRRRETILVDWERDLVVVGGDGEACDLGRPAADAGRRLAHCRLHPCAGQVRLQQAEAP